MPLNDSITTKPQEIAAIDLGSNSFHMIIARVVNGALQVLGRVKQRVYLADGLDKDNYLSEEAMARGLSCLSLFAERLQGFSPDSVRVVGTHTLRLAVNGQEFLQRATEILPYPIEIISGQEEARLIYMGVAHTQPEKGKKLVIDIGGGSTELVIGEDFSPILAESRRMGCVSFSKQFFPNEEISKQNFHKAQLATEQKLENLAWQYRLQGWQYALGASGTIKAVHNVIVEELAERDGIITPERLAQVVNLTLKFKSFRSIDLDGLSPDRQSVFVPGLAILCGVFNALDIKELRLSDGALREGVLYEMESRFRHQDIRSRTAISLAEHYNIDREQASRVLDTTQQLYAQWLAQNSSLANPQLEALLGWAAMLHEVGLSINHSNMQRHSAYILQNTNLPGFNQEHQLLLATLVRFHRKGIKLDELPSFNLVKKRQVIPLIQLLRLAILLSNQRQATTAPEYLRLISDDYHITLIFPQGYMDKNSLVAADLEREQEYWQDVAGWKLKLKSDDEKVRAD
ncbi:Exopolyphosphatase [Pragia fontium]|uniref:Exopolyphosphatase n=2 Tax=Pragia fontium TaxID=82985 RepID=A0AAJ4WBX8_9GAMM|nr:exopolyphosphatase [Pragia fontium]AKJ42564.1 exopolyphosphatase [Pragia fontium]GKX62605.1 exopolyphosphatase [Pragia fontium]SFD11984.1 exopolyphosphatase / guanosine-5'-triphosphate,3'-diphosphate pyrophosphatase [Pragia fontium DSM 5563 = ATCC 49100]SUB82893.1 Exopolyphosphatase [Pragia fontium]